MSARDGLSELEFNKALQVGHFRFLFMIFRFLVPFVCRFLFMIASSEQK
jgi:hypothetical protein